VLLKQKSLRPCGKGHRDKEYQTKPSSSASTLKCVYALALAVFGQDFILTMLLYIILLTLSTEFTKINEKDLFDK